MTELKTAPCEWCGAMMEEVHKRKKYCCERCAQQAAVERKPIRRRARKQLWAPPADVVELTCSRAEGRQCLFWRPLYPSNGNGVFCCHRILVTGKSCGRENPCRTFVSGTWKGTADQQVQPYRSVKTEADLYHLQCAGKRKRP